MRILHIFGSESPKSIQLEQHAAKAVKELGIDARVERITKFNSEDGIGFMMTPALAVDGEIRSMGKVPSPEEIKNFLM